MSICVEKEAISTIELYISVSTGVTKTADVLATSLLESTASVGSNDEVSNDAVKIIIGEIKFFSLSESIGCDTSKELCTSFSPADLTLISDSIKTVV